MIKRGFEIQGDGVAGDPLAQEVCPSELAKRGRPLCEAAGPAKLARQTSKRVIAQGVDRGWDFAKGPAFAVSAVGMAPPLCLKSSPEVIRRERAEVGELPDQHLIKPLLVSRTCKVVAVDQVKNPRRAEDDRRNQPRPAPATRLSNTAPPPEAATVSTRKGSPSMVTS